MSSAVAVSTLRPAAPVGETWTWTWPPAPAATCMAKHGDQRCGD
ncbi:hypothetical protein [Paraconexibacter antarcticus]|nr:hypothetical protein [Paraconexibacter antarcticus]